MKKGFTLVELLGVIIILSIISLIITPSILDYVNKSKVSAYRTSVQTVMDKAKEYVSQNEENNDFPIGGINILETDLKLEKENFLNGIIERNTDGEVVAVNVYNGTYCANGTKQNLVVEKASSLEDCENIDATAPELKIRATKITSNKIMVVAIASDSQSGIKDYKYCIGDNCSDYIKTNYYEFTGLKSGQTYEITVSVRNNNTDRDEQYTTDITETELKIKVTTLSIEEPTFEVSSNSYSGSKEVTIKYGEVKEGYEYGYEFTDENGVVEAKQVTNKTETITITKNGTLKAYIRKDSEEVSNELTILGIDSTGPEVYVVMSNTWEKNKQITIIAKETGSGLSSKPYSYDGGKSWTNNNKRTYQENGKIELVVRDKIGNKTTKYKICEDESLSNCYEIEELVINKIDTTSPICSLKATGLEGTSNWFRSDVEISFEEIADKQSDGTEGSGVIKQSIDKTTLTDEGTYKITGTVEDEVGNTGTCSIEIGIDKTPPTIEITMSGTEYESGYQSGAQVTVKCSDTNTVIGDKTETLTTKGTNTVDGVCTDIAGNETSDSKDYLIYVNTPDSSCGVATCQNSACGVASTVYRNCTNSACGVASTTYKSCQNSACGTTTTYKSCATSACGVASTTTTCTCTLFKSCTLYSYSVKVQCKNTTSKKNETETKTGSGYTSKTAATNACNSAKSSCSHTNDVWMNGENCSISSSSGRQNGCGTEPASGSACNNAKSKNCTTTTTYNTCTNLACGVASSTINTCITANCGVESTTYNSCRTSVCGVDYYVYNSCQTSACGYNTCWHT